MRKTRFYPSGLTMSILSIVAGIVILANPNILEILLAWFLVIVGIVGLIGSLRK